MPAENKPKLTPVFDNLNSAIKTWWKNLKKFVLIYLWGLAYALIPAAIAALLLGLQLWFGDRLSWPIITLGAIIFAVCFLALLYFCIRTYIGLYLLVKNNYVGKEHDIYKESEKYFWPYLGVVIPAAVLTLFWTVLLIIPGIIFGVYYSFSLFALFFEDKKGLDALSKSKRLVKGYWWPVFGRFFLMGVIAIVFSIIITLPISGQGADPSTPFYQIWSFLVQVVNYLIGPIYMIYIYGIYQDLVKIKK